MKKILEYVIMNGTTTKDLSDRVKELIAHDFQPFGNICVTPPAEGLTGVTYSQPMVKYGAE